MTGTTKRVDRCLPAGWHWVRLGELVDQDGITDGPFGSNLKTEHYTDSGARVIRLQNIGTIEFLNEDKAFISQSYFAELRKHSVQSGDLIVAALGDGARPAGRACLVPENFGDGLVKADCFRVRLLSDKVSNEFICYYMNSRAQLDEVASAMRGATRPRVTLAMLRQKQIPLPPLDEQRRIARILREQIGAIEKALGAAQDRLKASKALPAAMARETLSSGRKQRLRLGECLIEVRNGVGPHWTKYSLFGATRVGLATAKESVGKAPERYKLVDPVTVFYNPMRILLGSIAMVDEGDPAGITSPDYVVVKGRPGVLDTRWFYYWFRSSQGAHLIDSLSRGAVRERILFNRLSAGEVEIPDYDTQVQASERMKKVRPIVMSIIKEIETIKALPSALLRRAFNGEI